MIRSKALIAVLVVVLGFYLVLLVVKGVDLMRGGSAAAILLGIALVVMAGLGAVLVLREIRFGSESQRLAEQLAEEGGLPVDDLPRRPSGRVDRAAADAHFERMRAEVEANPDDWRAWYRLALAYDAAGDRRRGRAAAREALTRFHH